MILFYILKVSQNYIGIFSISRYFKNHIGFIKVSFKNINIVIDHFSYCMNVK